MTTWTLIDENYEDIENDIQTFDSIDKKIQSFLDNLANLAKDGNWNSSKKPDVKFIICEGDSWFDYANMLAHIIKNLKASDTSNNNTFWVVVNIANNGDALIRGILSNKQRHIFKQILSKYKQDIKCVLLSAGGNDVIDNMGIMFDDGKLDTNALKAQIDMLEIGYKKMIKTIQNSLDNPNIPIFTHGYSYFCAFGKECGILKKLFSNCPWIRPHMREHNMDAQAMADATKQMLDDFFNRIDKLSGIVIVDTRKALQNQNNESNPDYWTDEIHPTEAGIKIIANDYVCKIIETNPDLLT